MRGRCVAGSDAGEDLRGEGGTLWRFVRALEESAARKPKSIHAVQQKGAVLLSVQRLPWWAEAESWRWTMLHPGLVLTEQTE